MENLRTVDQPVAAAVRTHADDQGAFERIGDIAKEFDVTLRTLRFYEDKGLLTPKRDGVMRLYSRRDKARLKLILLGRKVGFSLREVKQMIDLYEPAGANTRQLRVALEKGEKQLSRLQAQRLLIEESMNDLSSAIQIVRIQLAERASQPPRCAN